MSKPCQNCCPHDGGIRQTPFPPEEGGEGGGHGGFIRRECAVCGAFLGDVPVPYDPVLEEEIAFCTLT